MSEPAPLGISFPNILFQVANFLLFLWVLHRLLFKPLVAMLERRRQRIAASLDEAENLRKQVESERAEFQAELANARAEAQRIREEASRAAETLRVRELEQARVEAERILIHHRAVQVAQRGCTTRDASLGARSSGPRGAVDAPLQEPLAEDPWVALCGAPKGAYAAHGAFFNGHRRWVEDQVRELPESSDTASSIGGD